MNSQQRSNWMLTSGCNVGILNNLFEKSGML
ncbi:hypothetical protein T12_9059 [Trichinella patagoniensis]|uniref:Uncharacterized protein n=1 Tax=Trichinella patagoniensis TaxID=990121 RepID=A0A0V0XDZ5_9BILA|nr:hypothetical protein T12_9059 [Trichinella patagoniensis]